METRINFLEKGKDALKTLYPVGGYLAKSQLGKSLLDLVYFRVSQINGCAFCLDMHSKDLRAAGETEQRLHTLNAWREAPFYNDRERAALDWAEAVTKITNGNIPDEVFAAARKNFSEQELIDLTLAITTINTYNRINIAFRPPVGTYVVGQFN
ncbi:MAG TPA: carboxymuconolactone decarboxylase family protein [Ginsengibacter sp.]|nr:carboxymuconolactone decarboxylase family protein [Ginsengibacter sp.]